jgi:hypothetical protein
VSNAETIDTAVSIADAERFAERLGKLPVEKPD